MKKSSLLWKVVLLFVLVTEWALANDSTATDFAKAVQAQENGQYKEAIKLYEQILETDMVSPALYNNLGLAYYNNKQLGFAIVQFERALKLAPEHTDAKHNLQAAQQRIEDTYKAPEALFFVQWWHSIVGAFSSTGWAVLFLCLIFMGVTAVVVWQWQHQSLFKGIAILFFCSSFFPLIWGFQQKELETSSNAAIVVNEQIGLRQEPDLSSEEIELVFEGVKVSILEVQDSWTHIELPNHLIGWVPSTMLEQI
ncbi:SH3 domain-containing protein [Aureispira sp. CCB-QB1]|uniref:tetratricopeptide repeat protein n=1 Tax=Aureispira sp. CCB-QB1 TaxID=1313421 RepID=UPI0006969C4E|nr:SH3 domain-containing protein [Aureispira sp. CCB-QB1]